MSQSTRQWGRLGAGGGAGEERCFGVCDVPERSGAVGRDGVVVRERGGPAGGAEMTDGGEAGPRLPESGLVGF